MSNALAIAAITATLRKLLEEYCQEELGGGEVTTKPPDAAAENKNSNQINIFLYQTVPNAAWRNQEIPSRVRPGETGQVPLALNLYYLVTAYAKDYQDSKDHRLLGLAMQALHDNAILNPERIRMALAESELQNQIDRLRITPQFLSLEEISKLWSTFQTQYRISAAYEVSVVLIDSSQPIKTPLPVLSRGDMDRGVIAQPDLISPFPTLTAVRLPNRQQSVHLGEQLTLQGQQLEDSKIQVLFKHPLFSQPIIQAPQSISKNEVKVSILEDAINWPAGFYTIALQVEKNGRLQTTNALQFALAPRLKEVLLAQDPDEDTFTLTVTVNPELWKEQQVCLLLGDRELLPYFEANKPQRRVERRTNTLNFKFKSQETPRNRAIKVDLIPPGNYFLRLRVDEVDSSLIDWSQQQPKFDSSQKVTVP